MARPAPCIHHPSAGRLPAPDLRAPSSASIISPSSTQITDQRHPDPAETGDADRRTIHPAPTLKTIEKAVTNRMEVAEGPAILTVSIRNDGTAAAMDEASTKERSSLELIREVSSSIDGGKCGEFSGGAACCVVLCCVSLEI